MKETLYLTDIPNITISNHPQPKLYHERMLKGTQYMNILERLVFISLGYFLNPITCKCKTSKQNYS